MSPNDSAWPVATRRQQDKERRRQEILDAAAELFSQRGFENVSFGDIAQSTGLSRSLIYFYFPDRQSLWLSAVLESCEKLHSMFLQASRGLGTGLARTEAMGRAYLNFHRENPANFHLFAAHEARPEPDEHSLQSRIAFHKRTIIELVETTLREGVADGSIRPDIPPPGELSFCLWSFVHGLAQLVAMKTTMLGWCGVAPDHVVDTGFRFLLHALKPRT